MKILCVCNQGENRSRTTAEILTSSGKHEARYDGFFKNKFSEAKGRHEIFDKQNLDWAEKIIVFEEIHEELLKQYGYQYWGRSYNFQIDDLYDYNQEKLRSMITKNLKQHDLL